ncbi:MAG: SAM-dependent methyltransferase [Alkalinema sp. FL-bin-369]|nr:SAM-dependent methyltransferase [Leptolyngbyaceae cyanobacterium LF-bin-369]
MVPNSSDRSQDFPGHPALCEILIHQMNDGSPITFAKFMEVALYHEVWGYYTTRATQIGAAGDFYTSPHLSAEFGVCMARQLVNCWENLGRTDRFDVVEMGAGQGIWAADILKTLSEISPECNNALTYTIVERSPSLRQVQQQQLAPWVSDESELATVQWRSWDEIPIGSVQGCFISNELVDAFAVHRVTVKTGKLQEIYVTWNDDRFVERIGDLSTPKLAEYFENLGLDLCQYAEGYQTEVNLNAIDWLSTVNDRLARGYVITIDYGYPASRYYSKVRKDGTLTGYFEHRPTDSPYEKVGLQDLTAHVDFTTLENHGKTLGLTHCGTTQQALFLMALGLGETIARLSQTETRSIQEVNNRLAQREVLHRLINPMGLGNFLVLIQSKETALPNASHLASNMTSQLAIQLASQSLLGLTIPDRRV